MTIDNLDKISPEQSLLGKKAAYESLYNPDLLFPIPRSTRRNEIGITGVLPFQGFDLWNHYEVSWLNEKGKPVVAIAEVIYGCESTHIIESKSMKLYFNSFNNSVYKNEKMVEDVVLCDLSKRIGHAYLSVKIIPVHRFETNSFARQLEGISIDELDIACDRYHTHADYLQVEEDLVEETLCSDLLKSNCLVTNQPDWCSVQITYKGKKINREGLLRYLVSFRNDNEFHEQCIEKIFIHLLQFCQPIELSVYGRSTRRGGIDINSYRTTLPNPTPPLNLRLCRQ